MDHHSESHVLSVASYDRSRLLTLDGGGLVCYTAFASPPRTVWSSPRVLRTPWGGFVSVCGAKRGWRPGFRREVPAEAGRPSWPGPSRFVPEATVARRWDLRKYEFVSVVVGVSWQGVRTRTTCR